MSKALWKFMKDCNFTKSPSRLWTPKKSAKRCQGDLRAYELWPHIFPLDGDHMKSTMLEEPRIETGETFQFLFQLVLVPCDQMRVGNWV